MEDEPNHFFKESQEILQQYVRDKMLLFRLQFAEKTARLIALLFSSLIIALVCFFILLFLSLMAGFYFASITGNWYLGFAIITAFYFFLFLLLIYKRNWVAMKVSDICIKIFFDRKGEENDKL